MLVRPLTAREWTYGVFAAACGAWIEMSLPCGRLISILGNRGDARTSSARDGTWGYMPSAAKTYQEDIAPRSSLPGMPPGRVDQRLVIAARTVSCVLCGAPA